MTDLPKTFACFSFLSLFAIGGCSSQSEAQEPPVGGTGGDGGASASGGADAGGTGAAEPGASGGSGTGGSGAADENATFRVVGRELQDPCGEKVVLRGVNEMVVWSPGKDGDPEFGEIAKSGANSVRIVWNEEGSAAELDVAIANALAAKMIPMIEHHSATGDLSRLPETVDYWTQADVVAVIEKYENQLLLNIANESGDGDVTAAQFEEAYKTAITRIRDTGVVLPLIIDAPQWGQNIDVLQAAGPALIEHDPESNLMFSVHMWWDDESGDRVKSELQESVDMNLPLIVGEFAQHSVWQCAMNPFAYKVLMAEAEKHEVGWFAWSWGGVDNGDCSEEGEGSFDMTIGGVFGEWEEPWGGEVAVSDPNSITNTSEINSYILSGSCE